MLLSPEPLLTLSDRLRSSFSELADRGRSKLPMSGLPRATLPRLGRLHARFLGSSRYKKKTPQPLIHTIYKPPTSQKSTSFQITTTPHRLEFLGLTPSLLNMAEALGVAASILGIIQLATQATKLTYEYVSGVKRAPDNLKKFGSELKSLTQILTTVQEYASTNVESKALCKLNEPGQPLHMCLEELTELLQKLEFNLREIRRWKRMLNRLKWPLKEKETADFLTQIERWKGSCLLALTLDQAAARNAEALKSDAIRNEGKRDEILNWLYSEAFDKRHVEISGRRQANTGNWLLESPEVKDWIKLPKVRTLWGYGIPGAGKTFLSSLVIDRLQELAVIENYGVAYMYFNFKEQEQQLPMDVLTCLVKQLVCQIRNPPKELEDLYDRLRSQRKRPTLEEIYTSLTVAAKSFTKTFIVCDALDECNPTTQRRILLPLFNRMEKDGIRLFMTSREYPEDIQQSLESSARVKLWAKDEDISTYIEQKIAENPRASRLVRDGDSRNKIITQLKECANGMFLLVHFHIEYLCQQTTLRRIMAELEKLKRSSIEIASSDPTSNRALDPTYDRAMRIIRSQPESCVELASKVILWLVKSKRTLTISELQMAVSVEQSYTIFDEMELPDRKTMLDVCASLVTVDDTDTVRLAHYTVQEYLLKNSIIPEDGFELAMVCTTFLSFDIFARPCDSTDSLKTRYAIHPFLDYAAQNLDIHLKECTKNEDDLAELVIRLLENLGNRESYLQAKAGARKKENKRMNVPAKQTALHVAACLGHLPTVRLLVENGADLEALDQCEVTPIYYAIFYGHTPMFRLLVEKGSNILSVGLEGESLLYKAAEIGDEEAVRILLEHGADSSITDCVGLSPLHMASENDSGGIAQLLLDYGADISAPSSYGHTVLHRAVTRGAESVVKLLLKNGADVSAVAKNGKTALHLAAVCNKEHIARILLENNAEILAVDKSGFTPLHDGVVHGGEAIVKLLLQNGADILATTENGDTTIHMAASSGNDPIIKILLENGANTLAVTSNGETALHKALSYWGKSDLTVRLLLDKGVDILASTKEGVTALHKAAAAGNDFVARLLIERGADVFAVTNDGHTALHKAARGRKESIVRLLLEKGSIVSAVTGNGETALHKAATSGSVSVVQLLLDNGADILAVTNDGKTALHTALSCWGESEPVIRLLLDKGANISASTNHGDTVLHKAAGNGGVSLYRLLIERGADISAVNRNGWSVLHMAVLNKNQSTIQLLLEKGANPLATTTGGETPLHMAAINGSEPIIRLLLQKDADPSATTKGGETALHMTAFHGGEPAVRLLLEKGANISTVTKDGMTALHFAVLGQTVGVVRLLLEKGLDPLAVSNSGHTPLHYAVSNPCRFNPVPMVKLLLEKILNPSTLGSSRNTVLHSAALGGDESLFELLLEKGFDPFAVTSDGETLLHSVASGGRESMVRLLLEKGLNPLAVTKSGKTALHCAVSYPDLMWRDAEPVVKTLLEKGVDISTVTNDGQTALQMAVSKGNEKIIHLLNCAFDERQC